ncbi:Proliferating cell nuclear antigen, PCNA, N-terminal [Dillenia turbinata]|uniref:Proliferating cell nuclear antigen, PCNA, N-terminal n=1 Tax=Dillenia turbinata TaxID=194707 RepID=A0AAN8V8C3_9MAGN
MISECVSWTVQNDAPGKWAAVTLFLLLFFPSGFNEEQYFELRFSVKFCFYASLISLLRPEGLEHYRSDRNVTMGVNLANMAKLLRCAGPNDIITIEANDRPDSVSCLKTPAWTLPNPALFIIHFLIFFVFKLSMLSGVLRFLRMHSCWNFQWWLSTRGAEMGYLRFYSAPKIGEEEENKLYSETKSQVKSKESERKTKVVIKEAAETEPMVEDKPQVDTKPQVPEIAEKYKLQVLEAFRLKRSNPVNHFSEGAKNRILKGKIQGSNCMLVIQAILRECCLCPLVKEGKKNYDMQPGFLKIKIEITTATAPFALPRTWNSKFTKRNTLDDECIQRKQKQSKYGVEKQQLLEPYTKADSSNSAFPFTI